MSIVVTNQYLIGKKLEGNTYYYEKGAGPVKLVESFNFLASLAYRQLVRKRISMQVEGESNARFITEIRTISNPRTIDTKKGDMLTGDEIKFNRGRFFHRVQVRYLR